jgi:hypothetical protein
MIKLFEDSQNGDLHSKRVKNRHQHSLECKKLPFDRQPGFPNLTEERAVRNSFPELLKRILTNG